MYLMKYCIYIWRYSCEQSVSRRRWVCGGTDSRWCSSKSLPSNMFSESRLPSRGGAANTDGDKHLGERGQTLVRKLVGSFAILVISVRPMRQIVRGQDLVPTPPKNLQIRLPKFDGSFWIIHLDSGKSEDSQWPLKGPCAAATPDPKQPACQRPGLPRRSPLSR